MRRLTVTGLALLGGALSFGYGCEDAGPAPSTGPTSGPTSTTTTSGGGMGGVGGNGGDIGGSGGVGGIAGVGGVGGQGGDPPDEECHNGDDDNGDGRIDCLDADPECAAICADACAAPIVLGDPGTFNGDTTSHAVIDGASCTAGPGPGPGHVFAVTATQTGVLEVYLATDNANDNFSLSIRSACDNAATEVDCSERVVGHEPPAQEFASLSVMQGDTYFLVVQGFSFLDYGDYVLSVATRVPDCPDGSVDAGEECDDGDMDDGNGCSNTCVFQPTETESNDLPADADDYAAPWFAEVSPLGDRDLLKITVPVDNYGVVAHVFDLGNGACAMADLDSYVQIFDSGLLELAADDNSGDGLCSRVEARGLVAGDYYVRVGASPTGLPNHTFQYNLVVESDECGNMTVAGPEECDDGNLTPNDGCSAFCKIE